GIVGVRERSFVRVPVVCARVSDGSAVRGGKSLDHITDAARTGGLAEVCRLPGQPGQTRIGERGAQTQQMLDVGDHVSSADWRGFAGSAIVVGRVEPLKTKGMAGWGISLYKHAHLCHG